MAKPFHQQGRYNAPNLEPEIAGKPFREWKKDIQSWVKGEITKDTISFANDMGSQLKQDNLTTSQIRNIFGEMRKIQMNGFTSEVSSFLLLKAKLAYAVKRQNAKGMEKFYELFCWCYEAVDTDKPDLTVASNQYNKMVQVMEAVLAYHKYHGGQ